MRKIAIIFCVIGSFFTNFVTGYTLFDDINSSFLEGVQGENTSFIQFISK